MKKIFLFAAAVAAALTVNAKVLDLTAVATSIDDWTVNEATLNADGSDAEAGKFVYDIVGGIASETFVTAEPDFIFQIKNGSDKAKAFVVYPGKCYEFGGKNGILVLKYLVPGDVISLKVAAKGDTPADFSDPNAEPAFPKNAIALSEDLVLPAKSKGAEGADEQGYIWKTLKYEVTAEDDVQIKEFKGGFRLAAIAINEDFPQGIDNMNATVKAEKRYENGQLVIIKNGVKYNALGAQF